MGRLCGQHSMYSYPNNVHSYNLAYRLQVLQAVLTVGYTSIRIYYQYIRKRQNAAA